MTILTDQLVVAIGAAMLKGTILVAVVLGACIGSRRLSAAWRHALLVAGLGAYAAIVLHSLVAPNAVWRVLPVGPAVPIQAVRQVTSDVTTYAGTPLLRDGSTSARPELAGSIPISLILAIVWSLGAAVLLLRLGIVHATARRMLRRAGYPAGSDWQTDLEACAQKIGVSRPVSLRLGDVRGPFLIGIRRPTIMLPAEAATWPVDRRRIVLLHELAHVKRRDFLTTFAIDIVRALSWPNPLILAAIRRAVEEREVATDDAVLNSGVAPWLYVEEVVQLAVGRWSGALQPALTEGRTTRFERRMRHALSRGPSRLALRTGDAALVTLIALVAAGSLAGLARVRAQVTGALMTGCSYDGGAHLDVRRQLPDGRPVWIISWAGSGCEAEARFLAGASVDVPAGTLALPGATDTVTVQVTRGAGTDSLVVSRAPTGLVFNWRPAGAAPERLLEPPVWVTSLIDELDQHSGFGAAARVPQLLAEGGLERVLREAERMQVDHAVGRYLEAGLRSAAASESILRRVIDVAGERVTNDAQLTQVLIAAAGQAGLAGEGLQLAYLRASTALSAIAAREQVVAALARHHVLTDSASRVAARLRN